MRSLLHLECPSVWIGFYNICRVLWERRYTRSGVHSKWLSRHNFRAVFLLARRVRETIWPNNTKFRTGDHPKERLREIPSTGFRVSHSSHRSYIHHIDPELWRRQGTPAWTSCVFILSGCSHMEPHKVWLSRVRQTLGLGNDILIKSKGGQRIPRNVKVMNAIYFSLRHHS